MSTSSGMTVLVVGNCFPKRLEGGVAIVDLDGDERPELVFVDGGDLADCRNPVSEW